MDKITRISDWNTRVSSGLPNNPGGSYGNGGEGGDGMEARVARLEAGVDHLQSDVVQLKSDMRDVRDRLIGTEKTLDLILERLSRVPTHWDMAKIVFYVVGALMVAAIWGPRAVSLLQSASP